MIRSYCITLWKDGQLWERGFLCDPGGTISLYASSNWPMDTEFTAATLPPGVQVCPSLTFGHDFAPKAAQDAAEEVARRYGYEMFFVDIVPW